MLSGTRKLAGQVYLGLRGWFKLAMRRDLAGKKVMARRRKICLGCKHVQINQSTGAPHKCNVCGCFLHAKLQLGDSHCPLDKW